MSRANRSQVGKFPVADKDFIVPVNCNPRHRWVCVAVATKAEGVAVRDTKDRTKKTLFFSNEEWAAFVKGVKKGEFEPKV